MEASYRIIFRLGKYFFAEQFVPAERPQKHWYWFVGKQDDPGSYWELFRIDI